MTGKTVSLADICDILGCNMWELQCFWDGDPDFPDPLPPDPGRKAPRWRAEDAERYRDILEAGEMTGTWAEQ